MFHYFLKKRLKKHDAINNLKIREIIRTSLLQQAALEAGAGQLGNDKPHDIVVSLTSYKARIEDVYLCIESLFQQFLCADHIVLWLSEENFPGRQLPASLLRQQQRGLEIRFVDGDLGSYKKYVYAFDAFPESLIITVDDDVLYPPDMIDMLYRAYVSNPQHIYCHRSHCLELDGRGGVKPYNSWALNTQEFSPSFLTFPTGVGGVLYPPGSLFPDAFNHEKLMALCPNADDIWLKAMSTLQGVKSVQLKDDRPWKGRFLSLYGSQASALKKLNWRSRNGNDSKIAAVCSEYDLLPILYGETSQ